jgi:histidinol-phosphate aminotransferase
VPIIVDEAYNELTDKPDYTSMVDLVRDGENVIVMRTFSKIFGMAGLRVGYTLTSPEHASTITKHIMSWPNVAGFAAAKACITDEKFINYSRSKIFQAREIVNDTFRENGITPVASQTNFVLADIGRNAAEFVNEMADRNILIQGNYSDHPTYVRISMGLVEEVEVFRRVFTDLYNA